MKTINYQGREIEVDQVCGWSGDLAIRPEVWHQGKEEIYRDADGQYYLARCLQWLDIEGSTNRHAFYGLHIHRITLRTAALWAVVRANNGEGGGLRDDLNAALQALTSTSATRHFADGSMAVTLHLKPEPAGLLREACKANHRAPLAEVYAALRCSVVSDLDDGDSLGSLDALGAVFDDNAPSEEAGELPGFSDLDEHCQYLLREYVESRGVDARDALNGAVEMALSDGGLRDNEATEAARVRRLERESDGGCTLRFVPMDGTDLWVVRLDAEEAAALEERCQETGLSFADVVKEMIRNAVAGQKEVALGATATNSQATLSGLVSPETFEAAARYTAEHGRTVEEAVAELLKGFADETARAADRPDLALCAAATPNGDDDESEDSPETPPSLPTGDDEGVQGTRGD